MLLISIPYLIFGLTLEETSSIESYVCIIIRMLLFQSYDLPLNNAAKDRDLEGVMSALKNGANVNYKDKVSFK